MKKLLTIALIAAGMALATSGAKAQYMTGDLMMGFEVPGTGLDVLFNLGPAQAFVTASGPFSIPIGNLNAALISAFGVSPGTNANILAAIFGNLNPSDPNNTLYASRPHSPALSGSQQSALSTLMSSVESQYNFQYAGNPAIVQDSSTTPNTYYSRVLGGAAFNNYITEQQLSLLSFTLDRIPSTTNGGGAARTLGTVDFAIDGNGNITGATFNPVPEPSTCALAILSAGALAALARRRAKARANAAA